MDAGEVVGACNNSVYLCAAVSMAFVNRIEEENNAKRLTVVVLPTGNKCCEAAARLRLSKEGYTSAPGNSCTVSILSTLTAAMLVTQKKYALRAAQHTAGTNTSSRSPPSRSTPCNDNDNK